MQGNKFVVCFNATEQRFFQVPELHLVPEKYRGNFYRVILRLNFYEDAFDMNRTTEMRQLCYKKITNLMTNQKMWKNRHSFYLIRYQVRLLARRNNILIQQNYNESIDDDDSSGYEGESDFEDSGYNCSSFNMTMLDEPTGESSLTRSILDCIESFDSFLSSDDDD